MDNLVTSAWKQVRLLVFDLDGTLVDSKQDLALSVNAMRTEMGLAPLPIDLIASYVGDGVTLLVRRADGQFVFERVDARVAAAARVAARLMRKGGAGKDPSASAVIGLEMI